MNSSVERKTRSGRAKWTLISSFARENERSLIRKRELFDMRKWSLPLDISLSSKFVSRELDKTCSVIRSCFRDVISDDYKDCRCAPRP